MATTPVMTSAQIVAMGCLIAKSPGFGVVASGATTSPAGLMYNAILENLAESIDSDLTRGTISFTFNPGLISTNPQLQNGSGPYPLPSDFLRIEKGNLHWYLQGVPYPLVPIDFMEFDAQVQTTGNQSLPYWFVTDVSTSPAGAYVYPPPNSAYSVQGRYRRVMPVITSPESSTSTCWFPNSLYLYTKLAYEIMKITDDDRAAAFMAENKDTLSKYLQLADDRSDRAQKATLDRRTFGRRFDSLRNTKKAGW